jgi:hypothetical protein
MSFFFPFYKIAEQEGTAGLAWVDWYQCRGKKVVKEHGRVNIVQILCTCVCKWKNETSWSCSSNRGRER